MVLVLSAGESVGHPALRMACAMPACFQGTGGVKAVTRFFVLAELDLAHQRSERDFDAKDKKRYQWLEGKKKEAVNCLFKQADPAR